MSAQYTFRRAVQSPEQTHWLLRTGPAFVLLLALCFGYNWNYLRGGFQADEFFFLTMLRQDPLPYSRWLGLWSTVNVSGLTNIWWFEGAGDGGIFWRPLPSLILEGSVRLLGERAFPLHLLSVLGHGLVAGTLFLFVRRVTGRSFVALLAGLFFLCCEDHSMVVGWISTMTDIVCVFFINLALLAHVHWLQKRKPWALIASLAAMVPALLSKESAVVAPLAISLLALAMPYGRDSDLLPGGWSASRDRLARFLRDWLSWAPAIALLAIFFVVYKRLGFGNLGGGMYIDPFTQPVRYLEHLVLHLPVMWLATLSPVFPSAVWFWPKWIELLAAAGAVAFVVFLAGLWSMRRSGLIVWSMVVYLMALLPQMCTDASERGMYFPVLAASIPLALLAERIGVVARRAAAALPPAPRLTRFVGWAAVVFVLVPGIILSAAYPYMYLPSLERPHRDVATVLPYLEDGDVEHVVMLNTSGCFQTLYPPPIVEYYVGPQVHVWVLSSMNGVVSVERIDESSFVVHADRSGWLTNIFAGMLLSSRPLKVGAVYDKGLFTATLLELTPSRRDVLAVRFDMSRPLDDPGVLFVQWDGKEQKYRPIDLASLPPGQSITLADTSDLWASMM